MQKVLPLYINGLKIYLICQNEALYEEQSKLFKNFVIDDDGEVVKEIKVYYTKSQSIIDRLHNKIQIDDKHYSINPFGKHVFLVQEKENYDRYMSSNKESMSVKHKNGFFVVVGSENQNTKYAPYTLILELISRYNEEQGHAIFHSTGFTIGNKRILTVGESGSGKTTFLSKLFQTNNDMAFLSNDRVFVGNGKMYYFPIEIILSMGTVKNSLRLKDYFIKHKITNGWLNKSLYETKNSDKCGIKPRTFCEINNLKYIPQANLSLIVFPQIDFENKNSVEVKILEKEEIVKKLKLSCYTPHDKEAHRDMWIDKGILTLEELEKMSNDVILSMSTDTCCISCKYGCNVTGEQILDAINEQLTKMEGKKHGK